MKEDMEGQNAIATAVQLTKDFIEPRMLEVGTVGDQKAMVLLRPEGMEVTNAEEFLDQYRERPRQLKGTARMMDLDSLIAHVRRFSDDDSVLFVDPSREAPSITAVLDYHQGAMLEAIKHPETEQELRTGRSSKLAQPRFGTHRSIYEFPLSKEWQAWLAGNEVKMTQRDFAEFLEDRILDVMAPPEDDDESAKALRDMATTLNGRFATPQGLMELSRGLAIHVDAKVKNTQVLSTGEVSMLYEETYNGEDGKPINVPSLFVIGIPVFYAGAPYRIAVRLRYRTAGGGIMWHYSLHNIERVMDHAIEEAAERARVETALPLFFGKPEA